MGRELPRLHECGRRLCGVPAQEARAPGSVGDDQDRPGRGFRAGRGRVSMPIRVRMTLWYAVLLALVVAAVGAFVLVRLRSDLIASIDRNLAPASRQITTGYEREGLGEFTDSSASLLAGERAVSQVLTRDG